MNSLVDEIYTHVYPVNDIIKHELVGNECICNPTIDVEDMIVIHDAMDGREN